MQTDKDLLQRKEILENVSVLVDSSNNFLSQTFGEQNKKFVRFAMAALSSVPWVGSFIGALANLSSEVEQTKESALMHLWLNEYKEKIQKLNTTIREIYSQIEKVDKDVNSRIESTEYLTLVRTAFRSWDKADTDEKREMLKKLITNAGATNLCPDDLIRLFINWIDLFHETHFKVISEIYKNPGTTRGKIWDNISGKDVRDDSSDADLFKYLIRDLSVGGVIRQQRETTYDGQFLKHKRGKIRSGSTMETPFEKTKPYELTELGKEFVHYVLTDLVLRIEKPRL